MSCFDESRPKGNRKKPAQLPFQCKKSWCHKENIKWPSAPPRRMNKRSCLPPTASDRWSFAAYTCQCLPTLSVFVSKHSLTILLQFSSTSSSTAGQDSSALLSRHPSTLVPFRLSTLSSLKSRTPLTAKAEHFSRFRNTSWGQAKATCKRRVRLKSVN